MSIKLSTGDVYLDHLGKLVNASFLHYKVTMFPFVIGNHLGEDTLRS